MKKQPIIFYVTKALYPSGTWFFIINTNVLKDGEKIFAIQEKMFAEDNEEDKSGNKILKMITTYLEVQLKDENSVVVFKLLFNTEFLITGEGHLVLPNNAGYKHYTHQVNSLLKVPLNKTEVLFFYEIVSKIKNLNCKLRY